MPSPQRMAVTGGPMKTFAALVAAATLLVGAGGAHASGMLGPPVPEARQDQLSVAVGYESDATKWKPGGGSFGEVSVSRNQAYLQLLDTAISFTEQGAAFIRVGGADFDDGASFQAGYKPFGSVGMKEVWYGSRRSSVKVGTILLASYYPGYEAEKTLVSGATVKAKIKNEWDVGLGIALQASLGEKISLYGGPSFVYGRAEVTREGGGFSDATTYEEKSLAGAFAGIGVNLSRRLFFFAEAQYRSDISAGASIAWSFD